MWPACCAAEAASSLALGKMRWGMEVSVMASRLAAVWPPAHIEMEVIAMVGVGVGAEHDVEAAAGGAVEIVQEGARLGVRAVPIVPDRDAAAVGKLKSGDVDRVGAAMFGQLVAFDIVDRAAGERAEALDLGD